MDIDGNDRKTEAWSVQAEFLIDERSYGNCRARNRGTRVNYFAKNRHPIQSDVLITLAPLFAGDLAVTSSPPHEDNEMYRFHWLKN